LDGFSHLSILGFIEHGLISLLRLETFQDGRLISIAAFLIGVGLSHQEQYATKQVNNL
jgi:hypothetical protein